MPIQSAKTSRQITEAQVREIIATKGWTPDIGQITPEIAKSLKRSVRAGELASYKGHWNTGFPFVGMGPLKTIYALPAVAAYATGAIYANEGEGA